MDDALYLKVSLPAEAFATILTKPPFAGTMISGPPVRTELAEFVLHYFDDWMPQRPKNFQVCEPNLPNARGMKCVFDYDDPKVTVLYLLWFET